MIHNTRYVQLHFFLALVLTLATLDTYSQGLASHHLLDAVLKEHEQMSYGNLPIRFEENFGQTDESVRFFSRGPGWKATKRWTPQNPI